MPVKPLPYDTQRFQAEISRAELARAEGKEGMARVCARRAAGLVAGAYLRKHDLPSPGPSAYDHLRALIALDALDNSIRQAADHLLLRINQDHQLPVDVDLIAEARLIRDRLFDNPDPT
jgi:hypothetical protein